MILDQLGEYSWAEWIIVKRQGRSKARLQATVKNLNRGLPEATLVFRMDGTGKRVEWTAIV